MTRTALITGASSGIGYELSRQFAADGHNIVLVARREQRLEEIAEELDTTYGVTATVISQDLATPAGPRELFDAVQKRDIAVHTLVNNAGFGNYGQFAETDMEAEAMMIELNITAVTRLSKLFVQPMLDRGGGGILNVASMASLAPTPNMAVYSSTKAYVRSLSEALAKEVADNGITVTALCPGPVNTEFGGLDSSAIDDGDLNDPKSVAEAGYEGYKQGETIVIPSRKMKFLSQARRVLPRETVVSMAEDTMGE